MKLIPEYEGPHWAVPLLLVAALFALCTNLGFCGDINDDINSYRQGAYHRESIGLGTPSYYAPSADQQWDTYQQQNAESNRNHSRFMDQEYGSQTPNPSCYLCNGY